MIRSRVLTSDWDNDLVRIRGHAQKAQGTAHERIYAVAFNPDHDG